VRRLVCLDTSFLIDLLRESAAAETLLRHYEERYEPLTTTPVNAAELFDGAFSPRGKKGEVAKVRGMLERLELLEMSYSVCEKYGRLVNELRSKGVTIGDLDTLIASAAMTHRQILVTRDKAHFEKVTGLVVESW
jgi:tRNA(fMet)-specific endonuclease VapC